MAASVVCRACGVSHDPLLGCPSKDAIISGLRKRLAETEALLQAVRGELAAAFAEGSAFDRVGYMREYMRRWRAKNRKKGL